MIQRRFHTFLAGLKTSKVDGRVERRRGQVRGGSRGRRPRLSRRLQEGLTEICLRVRLASKLT